ncbi:RHS repeat-associated core domain-containing protein [Andreprevotia sp. IGB-42]|uniref:RHS repeat-associated core domain-containing protein n=1 Tax=Andreprevotia sp. IGB-42 TaxID=2497473 RepID=UPI001357A776|nr:RHS repeat-associated core domain-containing protein [Andreprevotia sp. IGB-42]
MLKPTADPATPKIYYIWADQLGTPRQITDPASNAVVWRWDSEAFGNTQANQDPGNTGTQFVYNLRFPGQYYDAESGRHYNYFRDYDPSTGRYVQSDPIGLAGGSFSTYGYVNAEPLSLIDLFGLTGVDVDHDGIPDEIEHTQVEIQPIVEFCKDNGFGVQIQNPIPLSPGATIGTAGGIRAGKNFTQAGKNVIKERNAGTNNGITVCVSCGIQTVPAQQAKKGVTPPGNETHVDLIVAKSKNGDGAPSNGQVLCRDCNLKKSNK